MTIDVGLETRCERCRTWIVEGGSFDPAGDQWYCWTCLEVILRHDRKGNR